MSTRTHPRITRPGLPLASPIEALRGKAWLQRTLAAVVGMWQDRKDIDPVIWQRKLRSEWERNTKRRVTPRRSTKQR